MNNTVQNLST